MASLGTRSGSFVGSGNGLGMMQRSMSANGIASVANRAHLYQGVGPCMSADGVNEWLLQSKRGDSQSRVHAGEEVVSASNGHRSAAQQPRPHSAQHATLASPTNEKHSVHASGGSPCALERTACMSTLV